MATIDFNKENLLPLDSDDAFQNESTFPSSRKSSRKGRSRSIGPDALSGVDNVQRDARNRRKSAFVPATRSILAKNEETQKAARRKTIGNRRVSFAPEATLHTWDVIELGRDQTTSTESSDSTRRNSQFAHSAAAAAATATDSDSVAPSSSPRKDGERSDMQSKKTRRSSGMPPMNFNNPDDIYSSSIASEESGSEEDVDVNDGDDGDEDEEDDAASSSDTGTAMSLDVDDATMQSAAASEESTGSSARLEASLRQAAQTAGTRGIEYDEYGDMSMEIAEEEITNAFKPWAQRTAGDALHPSSMDQENINPFSSDFMSQVSEKRSEEGSEDEDTGMDMTRAVGGIMKGPQMELQSSPFGDGTMEMTQAVGKITSHKRQRSTAETGSPAIEVAEVPTKRRRSSAMRSSMTDDTMDLTMAVGGIYEKDSPVNARRTRSSTGRRRSSNIQPETEEATETMEFTRAVGGIKAAPNSSNDDAASDDDEDLSMELTTAVGKIAANRRDLKAPPESPATPHNASGLLGSAPSSAPKDPEVSEETPDPRRKKPLTPIMETDTVPSSRRSSRRRSRVPSSPAKPPSPNKTLIIAEQGPISQSDGRGTQLQPASSPARPAVSYPDLTPVKDADEAVATPVASPVHHTAFRTPDSEMKRQVDTQLQMQQETLPVAEKQQRSSPVASVTTPEPSEPLLDGRTLAQSIMMMSTPRKEVLKTVSPIKPTATKPATPKPSTPRGRPTPKSSSARNASPAQRLNEDLAELHLGGEALQTIGLQEFLTTAGIRFMDLTTTKRRVTTASTPSKAKTDQMVDDDGAEEAVTLESSLVAAACTAPELDLYRHACHELKRYTKEGKQMVTELEAETLRENPPLIRAYAHAPAAKRAAWDARMRDMKTNARFRSKELWYAWRSKLLDELMVGLQKIGEGLIADDDTIGRAETVLDKVLPGLLEQEASLRRETEQLRETANTMTNEEKEEVRSIRDDLGSVNAELRDKRRILEQLRLEVQAQDDLAVDLNEGKLESLAAIQEANRVREACRGVSLSEITALKESVQHLEDSFGWVITSASSSPSTVTLTYKSQLELTFQPGAFNQRRGRPNAPIRLSYIADAQAHGKKPLTTSLRFFLQLLRASLQALPQCTTEIASLLTFVSSGWDTAVTLAETERRLSIEAMTSARIVGDERLEMATTILLPAVRTKVRVTFALTAWVSADPGVEGSSRLLLRTAVEPQVTVVYGEEYNEQNMTEFMRGQMGDGVEDWDCAIQEIRAKLVARGVKGSRK